MNLTADEEAICEALRLGVGQQVAAEANGWTLGEYYAALRVGSLEPDSHEAYFRTIAKEAERAGTEYNERIAKYRAIIERHDAALKILKEKQLRLNAARLRAKAAGQTSLF